MTFAEADNAQGYLDNAVGDWAVLYCHTDSENTIRNRLAAILDGKPFTPFVPMKEMMFRRKGVIKKDRFICFPGYVFIEIHADAKDGLPTPQTPIPPIPVNSHQNPSGFYGFKFVLQVH